jgi:hypothetical protein
LFFIPFLIYTVRDNLIHNEDGNNKGLIITALVIGCIGPLIILAMAGINHFDIETPTNCCCCNNYLCHCIMLLISLCSFTLFIMFLILIIPTLIYIFYLYPARTLARTPLIVAAVIFINTLLAQLIYQCERFSYVLCRCKCHTNHKLGEKLASKTQWCTNIIQDGIHHGLLSSLAKNKAPPPPLEERTKTHNMYYESETKPPRSGLQTCSYCLLPIGTAFTIAITVMFLLMTTELTTLNRNTDDQNYQQLLTLVPAVALLSGFWINWEEFCGTKKKKREAEQEDGEETDQEEQEETCYDPLPDSDESELQGVQVQQP